MSIFRHRRRGGKDTPLGSDTLWRLSSERLSGVRTFFVSGGVSHTLSFPCSMMLSGVQALRSATCSPTLFLRTTDGFFEIMAIRCLAHIRAADMQTQLRHSRALGQTSHVTACQRPSHTCQPQFREHASDQRRALDRPISCLVSATCRSLLTSTLNF